MIGDRSGRSHTESEGGSKSPNEHCPTMVRMVGELVRA